MTTVWVLINNGPSFWLLQELSLRKQTRTCSIAAALLSSPSQNLRSTTSSKDKMQNAKCKMQNVPGTAVGENMFQVRNCNTVETG
jgi:hypothetical protein